MWTVIVGCVCFLLGFGACSLLTMSSLSDQDWERNAERRGAC